MGFVFWTFFTQTFILFLLEIAILENHDHLHASDSIVLALELQTLADI
jgi:hypothetical protein